MNNIEKLAIDRDPIHQDAITVKLIDFFGVQTKFENASLFIEALQGFSILQKTRALQSSEPVAVAWESKAGTRLNISWLTDTSDELISEGIEAGKVASYLYTLPPSTVPLEEHNKRIAELEAELQSETKWASEYAQKALALEATNKKLLDALERYEKNGVTCQTYRHFIDVPCAECNVQAIADAEGVDG